MITVQNRKGIADGTFDITRALATGWQEMEEAQRSDFQRRFEAIKKGWQVEKEFAAGHSTARHGSLDGEKDEDTEMGDGEENGGANRSGFIPINRG